MSAKELRSRILSFLDKKVDENIFDQTLPLVKERIHKLSDYWELAGFFFEEKSLDPTLFGKNHKKHLEAAVAALGKVSDWKKEKLDEVLMEAVKDNGFKTGDFFMDLRIAICGSRFTPPINDSIAILGKEETLKRLKKV